MKTTKATIQTEHRVRIVALTLMKQAGFEPASLSHDILTSDTPRARLWVRNAREIVKALEQVAE